LVSDSSTVVMRSPHPLRSRVRILLPLLAPFVVKVKDFGLGWLLVLPANIRFIFVKYGHLSLIALDLRLYEGSLTMSS
jgi:hypothetical protein